MSDIKKSAKPRTLQVVNKGGTVSRVEPEPQGLFPRLAHFLFSARRNKQRYEALAEEVRAKTQVGEAYIELGRTASRFQDLGNIIAADKVERDHHRASLENKLAAERREANTRTLQDAIHQEELSARLAEAKAKRRRLEETLKRESTQVVKDEATLRREAVRKMVSRKLDSVSTVQELRAEEERLIAEVKKRHGGVLTPDAEREIQNIRDAVQQAIDEL